MNTQAPGGQLNNAVLDSRVPVVTPEQVRRVRLLAANVADRDGWIYAEHAPLAEVLGMLGIDHA